jgi:hypothetical protein
MWDYCIFLLWGNSHFLLCPSCWGYYVSSLRACAALDFFHAIGMYYHQLLAVILYYLVADIPFVFYHCIWCFHLMKP